MASRVVRVSRSRFLVLASSLALVLATLVTLSLSVGSTAIPPLEALRCAVWGECGGASRLVVGLRATRTVAAALAGGMLAVAGALMQGVSRNPLADPFILGSSSTALTALSAAALLDLGVLAHRHLTVSVAFAGALLGYVLATSLSLLAGGTGLSLILSGVAVSALFSGVSHVLLYLLQDRLRTPYVYLLMGSASGVLERDLPYLAAPLALSLAALLALGIPKALNAYLFGDLHAAQLGYRPRLVSTVSAFAACLLTGASVAVVGIVGFVGLAAPHISRMLSGTSDYRVTIPLSALAGSSLVVLSDIAARAATLLTSRGEVPLGVVTSIVGAPFLAYLIVRSGGGVRS